MGFSFRGKASRPGGEAAGSDASPGEVVEINPEADLKKFKQLHKWDPFMEIGKLDAAEEFVLLPSPSPCPSLHVSRTCSG